MKRKLVVELICYIAAIRLFQSLFLHHQPFLAWYSEYLFKPFQKFRNYLFGSIPFSIGEFVYLFLFVLILVALIKILKSLKSIVTNVSHVLIQLIRAMRLLAIIYLAFLFSWGGNYYKQSVKMRIDSTIQLRSIGWNKQKLEQLNEYLVQKITDNAPQKQLSENINSINAHTLELYGNFFPAKTSVTLLKSSSVNKILSYIGVQGYYNPLSGEGHYNSTVHLSLQPFVFAHEMAHQFGIASETDANFLAYVLCKESDNNEFRYSAYLNLYLYANSELRVIDSLAAQNYYLSLPEITQDHIEEIKQIRRKYRSAFRKYTLNFYDNYLKALGQEQGLESYGEVSRLVYKWEFVLKKEDSRLIFSKLN